MGGRETPEETLQLHCPDEVEQAVAGPVAPGLEADRAVALDQEAPLKAHLVRAVQLVANT